VPFVVLYGVVLGWARVRTGGLKVPILLHMSINGLAAVMMLGKNPEPNGPVSAAGDSGRCTSPGPPSRGAREGKQVVSTTRPVSTARSRRSITAVATRPAA